MRFAPLILILLVTSCAKATPISVTAPNIASIIAGAVKATCAQYNSNRVTDIMLAQIVSGVINVAAVQNTVTTIEALANAACPLIAPPPATP